MSFNPLRNIPENSKYSSNDTLVVFGEVFDKGYINGLIHEAQAIGMKIIYATVGRRDSENQLRKLTDEELQQKNQSPLINIPLEAGFDLSPASDGSTPVTQLQGVGLRDWEEKKLDWAKIEESRKQGEMDFRNRVSAFLGELKAHLPENGNILFAHTMAGGFPRAKVVMPAANRTFKGFDDRYYSSEKLWSTDIGKLCAMSFNEVTGESLRHLIELTKDLREQRASEGKSVDYVAYGYHGTEVLTEGQFQWQSYSPYLQGWAKLRLEDIAKNAKAENIQAHVYNAPEILTNSTTIFLGVEVSLYPLIEALMNSSKQDQPIASFLESLKAKLKPEYNFESIQTKLNEYLTHPTIRAWNSFNEWPKHNGPEQMKLMRETSSELIAMHKDEKDLITVDLSEVVFKATGKSILHTAGQSDSAVMWIGHDLVSKLAPMILKK